MREQEGAWGSTGGAPGEQEGLAREQWLWRQPFVLGGVGQREPYLAAHALCSVLQRYRPA